MAKRRRQQKRKSPQQRAKAPPARKRKQSPKQRKKKAPAKRRKPAARRAAKRADRPSKKRQKPPVKRRSAARPTAPPAAGPPAAGPSRPAAAPIAVDVAEQEALRAKFELGPHEWTRTLDAREKAQTIPWGYGRDRVTAMAVDPDRLFVYWEVTDDAIAGARAQLATAAIGALVLRVHDVTGLLFDGDNAHHSFDLEVGRAERQRFHWIGRPTSTVIVELGLRDDGRFAAIARSGRVDFPRRDPAPAGPVEWLTVRELHRDGRGGERLDVAPAAPPPGTPGAHVTLAGAAWRAAHDPALAAPWADVADDPNGAAASTTEQWHAESNRFDEWFAESFGELAFDFDGQQFDWLGPRDERRDDGPGEWQTEETAATTIVQRGGDVVIERRGERWRIARAPWSIAIAPLRARGARRLLSRWELRRSWIVAASWLRSARGPAAAARSGRGDGSLAAALGSEARLGTGASEHRFLAASELRLGGASEERLSGASEERLGGAGSRELGGASEATAPRPDHLPPPLDGAWPTFGLIR